MARPESSDPLQSHRFHVRTDDGLAFHEDSEGGEAGFQSVTMPELTVEVTEYREGHYAFTRKFPGVPTVSDVTFMRGVTKRDTSFHDWIRLSVGDGVPVSAPTGGSYRTRCTIYHWHRDGKEFGRIGDLNNSRRIHLLEAFAMRYKTGGDLDSTSSEVSLAEVDVACESFEIENPPVA